MKVYSCNKCKYEMSDVYFSIQDQGVDQFMSVLGRNMSKHHEKSPSAFYCRNRKCERYGLLTKVAIVKEK